MSQLFASGGQSLPVENTFVYSSTELVYGHDSILKSRDITLLKKVHIVKDTVFPVVMYGCESWTITKAECFSAFKL